MCVCENEQGGYKKYRQKKNKQQRSEFIICTSHDSNTVMYMHGVLRRCYRTVVVAHVSYFFFNTIRHAFFVSVTVFTPKSRWQIYNLQTDQIAVAERGTKWNRTWHWSWKSSWDKPRLLFSLPVQTVAYSHTTSLFGQWTNIFHSRFL